MVGLKLEGKVESMGGDGNPIGTIISFMGTIAPDGYLFCDGGTYNIDDYLDLANFFEIQFGSKNYFGGDGSTTFAVPDLRGEFLRCTGINGHKLCGTGQAVGTHADPTFVPIPRAVSQGSGLSQYYLSWPKEFFKSDAGDTWPTAGHYRHVASPDGIIGTSSVSETEVRLDVDFSFSNYRNDGHLYDCMYTSRPTNTAVMSCIKY